MSGFAFVFAMVSFWLSGAWWDGDRKASTFAMAFAFLMFFLAVSA